MSKLITDALRFCCGEEGAQRKSGGVTTTACRHCLPACWWWWSLLTFFVRLSNPFTTYDTTTNTRTLVNTNRRRGQEGLTDSSLTIWDDRPHGRCCWWWWWLRFLEPSHRHLCWLLVKHCKLFTHQQQPHLLLLQPNERNQSARGGDWWVLRNVCVCVVGGMCTAHKGTTSCTSD